MSLAVSLSGLAELDKQLGELGEELGVKLLAKAARIAFMPVLDAARARVPVDTGLLRDSIRVVVVKPKNGEGVVQVGLRIATGKGGTAAAARKAGKFAFSGGKLVVNVGDTRLSANVAAGGARAAKAAKREVWRKSAHWRWHFVEFGTAHQAARPFLRPAMDSNTEQMVESLRLNLAQAIARALKKRGKK